MNLLNLFRKPSPIPDTDLHRNHRTGQFMPSEAERRRRANAVSVRLEFEMLKVHLPPEQFEQAVIRGATRSLSRSAGGMSVAILTGDCRERLAELATGSASACVTSVPYWQKRDYGHSSQIGMEERPGELVTELVRAFAEVRRILVPGGALWLNIADSYAAGGNGGGGTLAVKRKNLRTVIGRRGWRKPPPGFKNKDLVLVSFMLAEALRADGWWLRKTVIWSKPAASEPPRADRPSVSHEYLFLFSSTDDCAARDPGEPWWKTSVWEIPPSMGIGDHPAPMPSELARRCIVASSRPGDIILDPFGGAGTTGLVADQLQRNAVLIELNPEYVAIARKRIDADAGMFATEPA